MKKNTLYTIGLIIILAVLVIIFLGQKKKSETALLDMNGASHLCFEYKAPITGEDGQELFNKENVEFSIADDGQFTGTHVIAPAQGSDSRATLVGVTDNTFVNTIASVVVGEKTWKEQRVYKIDGDRLYIGYQSVDTPMKQEGDILMYQDIQKIIFDTEEFFLNKVTCINE